LRPVSINQVKPGMVVGRTVYSGDGRVLLKNGVALKHHYIDRLIKMGIDLLYVLDEKLPDVYIEDVVHQETRIAALTTVSQLMSSARSGQALSSFKVRRVVEEIVSEVVRNPASLIQLTEIRALNDYTFGHCVSVSVLSLVAPARPARPGHRSLASRHRQDDDTLILFDQQGGGSVPR